MIQLNRKILLPLFISCCGQVHAQQFKTKVNLQHVDTTGFYAVDISPVLSAFTAVDFKDLRVADDKENTVPYITRLKFPAFYHHNFERFAIVSNTLTDSGKSILVIENSQRKKVSDVVLLVNNAAVARTANISGSDDAKKWFTIAESLNLENMYSDSTDIYLQNVRFPLSASRYLKIAISNGRNDALGIVAAGRYTESLSQPVNAWLSNPDGTFKQADSNRVSYISVLQASPFHVDRIVLHLKGPKFFKREADLLVNDQIHHFSIASDTVFPLPCQPVIPPTF